MCGIAGLITLNGTVDVAECSRFIDSIAHRGPDGQGLYFDSSQQLFLGHRRLKILDLTEAGRQPMHSHSGKYIIVFNGEIYNFLELREELVQKGYRFRSQSDTEVILAAYEEWKEDCQLKFNGMWAFAIWDCEEKTLFLSRDRFGVKPLYIHSTEQHFAFASEIKAFAALSFVDFRFDPQAVATTLEDPLALEPTAHTIYRGIDKIPAGCCLLWQKDRNLKVRRWWKTLDHLCKAPESWAGQIESFRTLFIDACSVRMRSDVPIGTALSGGLDSSSILCSLFQMNRAQHMRWPTSWQKSFTAVFPNSSHDELEYAKIATESTKADSFFFPLSPSDLVSNLENTLYSIEDIFDPPIGPWLLYREYRKQGVAISIDGHGADELLCGYHHQFERSYLESLLPYPKWKRLKVLWPLMTQMHAMQAERSAASILLRLVKNGAQFLCKNRNGAMYHLLKKVYWRQRSRSNRFGRFFWLKIPPAMKNPDLEELHTSKEFRSLSILNQMLYLDFHFQTLPSILRNFDRCSMAHGVEIRAPFMDWRLVCYAFSLPSSAKVGELGSKQILRAAMEKTLPEAIRLRKSKIGFAAPINQWIGNHLKDYMLDIIRSQSFQDSEIWDGRLLAKDAEGYFAKKDFGSLRRTWEFILADRLMSRFKKQLPLV